jgi:phytoene desaturase
MYSIVEGMYQLALDLALNLGFKNVTGVDVRSKAVSTVNTEQGEVFPADVVIGGADYHFIEQDLLPVPIKAIRLIIGTSATWHPVAHSISLD